MQKRNSLLYYVLVFTSAQIAWLSLVGLWIYWYVSNYVIMAKVGERIPPQIVSETSNVFALVSGLILLVLITVSMSLIFIYLTKQMNITRLYDNFIANITYELKSPLSSIQLYLETLSSRHVPENKQKEFINLMIKNADRLNNLITSILHISQLEKKHLAYNFQVCKFDQLITELINEAMEQFKIDDKSITIAGKTGSRSVVDRSALKIVINNLFDNAIKYSIEPVKLKIDLGTNSKFIVVKVSDAGIGISPRDQKSIFQKFQRIYNKNIPTVKGTGLGLYWAREIIKYHGGRMSVSSAGIGKGTTFIFELPIFQTAKRRRGKRLLKITRKTKQQMEASDEF
ncbi:MAG: HAMP domain-containing histidine kinase [Calditrichaceae bacterium]|nr:HAMP domain-containing histidine kinase [Calditrichaceae bacterium]